MLSKSGRKLSNPQILINKFVDSERFSDKGFWPREMKIASKLIKTYDLQFLLWVIPPYGKKVPSLCYFIADYGQQYLQEAFFNYKKSTTDFSPQIQQIPLENDKIGEDVVTTKKPRTLKDFLGMYQTQVNV